jgi:hypothetical protein
MKKPYILYLFILILQSILFSRIAEHAQATENSVTTEQKKEAQAEDAENKSDFNFNATEGVDGKTIIPLIGAKPGLLPSMPQQTSRKEQPSPAMKRDRLPPGPSTAGSPAPSLSSHTVPGSASNMGSLGTMKPGRVSSHPPAIPTSDVLIIPDGNIAPLQLENSSGLIGKDKPSEPPLPGSLPDLPKTDSPSGLPGLPSLDAPTGGPASPPPSSNEIPGTPPIESSRDQNQISLPPNLSFSLNPVPATPNETGISSLPEPPPSAKASSLNLPALSLPDESTPSPTSKDTLPALPDRENDPQSLKDINIPPPVTDSNNSLVPSLGSLSNIPTAKTRATTTDRPLPQDLPSLPDIPGGPKGKETGGTMVSGGIEYRQIIDWENGNLLVDGDFEAVFEHKDSWTTTNGRMERVSWGDPRIPLTPKTGIKIGLVSRESDEKCRIYQMLNVDNLADLIDGQKVSLQASLDAAILPPTTGTLELSVHCFKKNGERLNTALQIVPSESLAWKHLTLEMSMVPSQTRWLEFRVVANPRQGTTGSIAVLDAALLKLRKRR